MTLHERLTVVIERSDELFARLGDGLSEEEQKEFEACLLEAGLLQKQIEQGNKLADLKKFHTEPASHLPLGGGTDVTVIADETDRFLASPEGQFKTVGEMMRAVYLHDLPGYQQKDKRLIAIGIKQAGLSEGVPADGGFLVQTDLVAELFTLAHSDGDILSRVRRIPIGANSNGLLFNAINETNRTTGNRWGGLQAYWLAEGGVKTESQPEFRQMELNLRKLALVMYATDELLQDTTALSALLTMMAAEEIRWMTEEAVFNGLGGGQPLGIMGHPSLITQAAEAGQAANTIVFENVLNMYSRRWNPSWLNMVWFINQDIEPQLMAMNAAVGAGGVMVYLPPGGLSAAPYGSLYGRPVIPNEHTATLGTTGDICLFDLSQYLMIDKGGIDAAQSMHVRFLYDEQTFRFVYRVDGQPLWNNVLTPANSAITQSPFIVLATRP